MKWKTMRGHTHTYTHTHTQRHTHTHTNTHTHTQTHTYKHTHTQTHTHTHTHTHAHMHTHTQTHTHTYVRMYNVIETFKLAVEGNKEVSPMQQPVQWRLYKPTLYGLLNGYQFTKQGCQDYPVFLSMVRHDVCLSEYSQIGENVGLYRDGLERPY